MNQAHHNKCDYTSGPEVTPAREDDGEVQTESESVEIGVQASVNTRNFVRT